MLTGYFLFRKADIMLFYSILAVVLVLIDQLTKILTRTYIDLGESFTFIPGLLDLGENADILALIAPRPLVIVNGREDDIFPLDAAQYEFTRLHARYQELGAGENCVHVIGDGGHRFYAEPAWNAMLPLWNR
mgnify:CR=1 FL=1